ncbi:MAG TPA: hypothetical protein VFE24_04460 [Pirellulales bacterium]|nr:hypothetical protein [Pirellulales bacterium]
MNPRFSKILAVLLGGVLCAGDFASTARAGGPAKESSGAKESSARESAGKEFNGKEKLRPLQAEHETSALGFVALNHPELVEVLNRLKTSHHAEYERAVRQIYQASERLSRLSKDDPEKHELELKLWKIQSRIQLMAAKAGVGGVPSITDDLRTAFREELDVKADLLTLDRTRHLAQAKKAELELLRLQEGRDKEVDQRINELKKEIAHLKHRGGKTVPASADSKSKSNP